MNTLLNAWKWLDGKKTIFAGTGFVLFGISGFLIHALDKQEALNRILEGAALLGIGGKVQKVIDELRK